MTLFRSPTRREFLTATTLTMAGIATRPRGAFAIPTNRRATAWACLPDPIESVVLQRLATDAMMAARDAGATYADVRVAERHQLNLGNASGEIEFLSGDDINDELTVRFEFGVRACVGGAWGFVYGCTPTSDAITAAVRGAVSQARRGHGARTTLAPTPVVTDSWTGPCVIDPFSVPLEEQTALLAGWGAAGERIAGVWRGGKLLSWTKEARVFASTEGTLTTQHVTRGRPFYMFTTNRQRLQEHQSLAVPSIAPACGGYEIVTRPDILNDIAVTAEEMLRIAAMPAKLADVGRYPVVVDGVTLANLCASTLLPALELDRVLGEEADASGTSPFSPLADVLGTMVTAPGVTLTTDRALPSVDAVKWDDEGVASAPCTLIQDGRLVDYQTSRASAPRLAEWYTKRGKPMASNGNAVAFQADWPVQIRSAHACLAPARTNTTVDDLIRSVERGIYVRNAGGVITDHQLSAGFMPGAMMFEIRQGRVTEMLVGGSLQFVSRPFWKSLLAVGGSSTMAHAYGVSTKGMPWRGVRHHVSAPAASFKSIDVIHIARHG